MRYVRDSPGIPGLWDGKDSGTERYTGQRDMSGTFPVSQDSGMRRTVVLSDTLDSAWDMSGRVPGYGKDSGVEKYTRQWNMSGTFPVSRDSGMGRTVALSDTLESVWDTSGILPVTWDSGMGRKVVYSDKVESAC